MKARLYLDIDGVLNSEVGNEESKKTKPDICKLIEDDLFGNKHHLFKLWDIKCVANLKVLLDQVKPDIYIHSTWKSHFKLAEFKEFFNYWGLDSTLIKGTVPQYKFSSERFHNLKWHIEEFNPSSKYVILDDVDMTNIFEELKDQIVTDPEVGLTIDNVKRALLLFNA